MSGASEILLERALSLDRDNQEARILLATSYERLGRYRLARPYLEEVVASNAQNIEARLRLAVLLAREGDYEESERLIRHLLGARIAGWRRSVAYQTLARTLFGRELFEEAVATLAVGVAELPDDQRLALLYAYALDRTGRRREAEAVLGELPAAATERSSRMRYNELPVAPLEPVREFLAQSLIVRLPILTRAIDETEAEGRGP